MTFKSNKFTVLFKQLYECTTDIDVELLIQRNELLSDKANWISLKNIYPQLIEDKKDSLVALADILNEAISAVIIKRSRDLDINPSSFKDKNISKIRAALIPDSNSWKSYASMKRDSRDIQVIADGDRMSTSLVIQTNDEGLTEDQLDNDPLGNYHDLFGQKKILDTHVHAIKFCGRMQVMLIGTKRIDRKQFLYTLIRSKYEPINKTNSNSIDYECFKINDRFPSYESSTIPSGPIESSFQCGTIRKLFSYQLPVNSRSSISKDLLDSLEEYLFNPVLPISFVEQKSRYDKELFLEKLSLGLHFKIIKYRDKYLENDYEFDLDLPLYGNVKIHCYLFKEKILGKHEQTTKHTLQKSFFKNKMSLTLSDFGRVFQSIDNRFIVENLGFKALKNHLLIHVDCTMVNIIAKSEILCGSGVSPVLLEFLNYIANRITNSELKIINQDREIEHI